MLHSQAFVFRSNFLYGADFLTLEGHMGAGKDLLVSLSCVGLILDKTCAQGLASGSNHANCSFEVIDTEVAIDMVVVGHVMCPLVFKQLLKKPESGLS